MIATKITVKTILMDFATPRLLRIIGEPNRHQLIKMHRLLCNTATPIGSRLYGYLELTLNVAGYHTTIEAAFFLLANPGPMLHQ